MSPPVLDAVVRVLLVLAVVLVLRPGAMPRRLPARTRDDHARGGSRRPGGLVPPAPDRPGPTQLHASGRGPRALAAASVGFARRRPRTVAAGVVGLVVLGPVPVVAVAGAVAAGTWWRRRRRTARGSELVADELPDVVDLLRLAVASGCTVHLAVRAVADHGLGVVADRFRDAVARTARGARLAEALQPLGADEPLLAPVVEALVAADRYGTPLEPVLVRLGDDARASRRRRAEAAARRVPVRLLFPLVACILPAVGLLTVVPVAVSAMRGLDTEAPRPPAPLVAPAATTPPG